MNSIEKIVQYAKNSSCSDVHLTEGEVPTFRRNGSLERGEYNEIVTKDTFDELFTDEMRVRLAGGYDLDFSVALCGFRQRVNIFRQNSSLAAAIRLLNDHIPTMSELKLPPVLKRLADEPLGLVLVTGPTGSGKSTTLASMIDYISKSRQCHIITIEDPIEYMYEDNNKALIHQREVGRDVLSFADALRSALREDPDVILVGEMRDFETISAAITAAETGHLVFSTLHTTGAARTVDRIIDVFPPHQQSQIRTQLAGVLKGVITQQLVPLADKSGRVAATEIMVSTDAVQNLVREGKCHQLNSVIQSGGALGMQTMEANLAALVRSRQITMQAAEERAARPDELRRIIR